MNLHLTAYALTFCFLANAFSNTVLGDVLSDKQSFPILFATDTESSRLYKDFNLPAEAELKNADAVFLEIECPKPEAIGSLTLYFKSDNGWYSHSFSKLSSSVENRNRFQFSAQLDVFACENKPDSWEKVDKYRVAAWRGDNIDTTLTITRLEAVSYPILAVLPKDRYVNQGIEKRVRRLQTNGLPISVAQEDELPGIDLTGRKVVLLPYVPDLSAESIERLRQFVLRGGKLIAFFSLPTELMNLLGFEPSVYQKSPEGPKAFAEVRSDVKSDVFGSFAQNSKNIRYSKPLSNSDAKVAAWWYDANGEKTNFPALLLSSKGAFFSHIFLPGDEQQKDRFLQAIFFHCDSRFAKGTLEQAWESLFSVGGVRFRSPEEYKAMKERFLAKLAEQGFESNVDLLENSHGLMSIAKDRPMALLDTLKKIREEEADSFCESVPSCTPEFRCWWEHSGMGIYEGDWDRTMREVSQVGFNAIMPNVAWGGSALYKSVCLPQDERIKKYGDQLEQAVQAGKKYGVEVHAWKVCYRLSRSPKDHVDQMRREKRLQVNLQGEEGEWLCPSHPDNIASECESLCEMVRNYDIAGIHFDYIRYPDTSHCFCDGCRTRFEQEIKQRIANWPTDLRKPGELADRFRQWRCDQITRLVEETHAKVKKIKPGAKISAAVMYDPSGSVNTYAQDWRFWAEKGYVDFLCPMNYTNSSPRFEAMLKRQQSVLGDVPVYPGIGFQSSNSSLLPDEMIGQMEIARKAGTKGFVVFHLNARTIESCSVALRKGATRKQAAIPLP